MPSLPDPCPRPSDHLVPESGQDRDHPIWWRPSVRSPDPEPPPAPPPDDKPPPF
jgi:hypothetical protein